MARFGRTFVFPVWTHGFLGNTPPNFTTPTPVLVVENQDRRHRYPPLDPIIISGRLAPDAPPQILTLDRPERRRHPPLDPVIVRGRADADLRAAIVTVDRPERRRQTPDPVVVRVGSVQPTGNFFRLF